jgi:hypothetical protein
MLAPVSVQTGQAKISWLEEPPTTRNQAKQQSAKSSRCSSHLRLTHSSPLPRASWNNTRSAPGWRVVTRTTAVLLLLVEHQLQHIIRKLRELETHGPELWSRIVAQAVAPRGPEGGHGLANSVVLWVGLLVDVARVCELALCGRGCAVDLAVCKGLELGELEAVGEGVDARVDKEAETVIVSRGLARVLLEGSVAGARCLFGEVFARVEVLDYGAHGVHVDIAEDDLAGL